MSAKCTTCGEWYFFDHHRCKPVFEASMVGYDEDDEWEKCRAHDEKEAAEKRLQAWNEGDAHSPSEEATVCVRREGSDEVKQFTVYAEATWKYHAMEDL